MLVAIAVLTGAAGTSLLKMPCARVRPDAAFMALLVVLSRVAPGVHWATDVLSGETNGLGRALYWLLLARTAGGGCTADSDSDGMAQP